MPSFIQAASGAGSGTAVASATLASNVTTGSNVLVFVDTWLGGGPVTSVTDPQGNTYTQIATFSASPGGQSSVITVWQANSVTGGWKTPTVNNSTSAFTIITVAEYSSGTLTFDKSVGGSSTTAGTVTTGNTATTTSATELLIAYGAGQNLGSGGTVTAGSGYTSRSSLVENSLGTSQGLEEQSVSATGAYSASLVFTGPNTPINVVLFLLTFSNTITATDVSKTHSVDAYVPTGSRSYSADATLSGDISKTFNVDADVQVDTSKTYTVDGFVVFDRLKNHNVDASVLFGGTPSYGADADVFSSVGKSHNVDAFILPPPVRIFINLSSALQFAIAPTGFIRLRATAATPSRGFVLLASTLKTANRSFIPLAATLQIKTVNYTKLAATLVLGKRPSYGADAVVAAPFCIPAPVTALTQAVAPIVILPPTPTFLSAACLNQSFVNLAVTLKGTNNRSFVRLSAWLIPFGATASKQMPGNAGFTASDDFNSSVLAGQSYSQNSMINISGPALPVGGINLIVKAFTAGISTFQTRTQSWLKRIDAAPNGILLKQSTKTEQLPNGGVITTTTQITQQKDVEITKITISNSATPTRTSVIITEKSASGATTTRETDTNTINGVKNSTTKKTVYTQPPTNDNIQPLQVRTLDGVIHYQWFGQPPINTEWAGGDAEGLTSISESVSITLGSLNGATTDPFGNPIYKQTTKSVEDDPTGKHIETTLEEIGTRRDIGSTVTDSIQTFNGISSTLTKKINYPDGSTAIQVTQTNAITGDTIQNTSEVTTDEYGQQTTTNTTEETVTFTDAGGQLHQTTTKTVRVTVGGVTKVDTIVTQSNDFEDDIIAQKIKVFAVQEFQISCIIDELAMNALADVNFTHQKSYALLELFGQQLGNGNLSYALRQSLIAQFNTASNNLSPLTLQAMMRNYSVVFAQSGSALKATYVIGTEPHVYEMQLILQARANIKDGTFGF